MNKTSITVLLTCSLLTSAIFADRWTGTAVAQQNWKTSFEELCSQTTNAMTLTPGELQGLIDRCDRLKPDIANQDESTAKVYLKRLKMCRDLYQFVLEQKTPTKGPR